MFSGDNALSEMVTITTGDDDILEPDETFQISASSGSSLTTEDVTIMDDDDASAEVRLGTSTGTVAEGQPDDDCWRWR